ncbi:hypothetical protein P12x_002559 [Tundrisphaera lichenicola]|uniref:hypothetical protein n=1 Tax=Tundrisphaera lichenicola TaxID=2029860 RepID=UPI003EBE9398
MNDETWVRCEFEGYFSVDMPENTDVNFEDDHSTVVFTLPSVPATQVVASVYPNRSGTPLTRRKLRSQIARHMKECTDVNRFVCEVPVDVSDELISYQCVGFSDEDRVWVSRIYGRNKGDQFLLIQWNGEPDQIEQFVGVFISSIEILFT